MIDKTYENDNYDYENNNNNFTSRRDRDRDKDKEKDKDKDKHKKHDEPTGEAETLIGRLHKFGDLAQREKIPRAYLERRRNEEKAFNLRRAKNENRYNPKTKDTQSIYEDIIIMVQKYLSDQPPEYVSSAVNEIIPIIKKTDISKEDKMIFIKNVLGKEITNEEINKFILLCKGLLDYNIEEIENEKNRNKNFNQEMEINMNLDIDDAQNKNDDNIQATTCLEIEEQEKSDDEENDVQMNNRNIMIDDSEINLDMIIDDISNIRKYLGKVLNLKEEKILSEKENDLYGYLSMENQNECENNLFMMLGNENMNFIQFLLINRDIILFLYSIQKADSLEKKTELINNLKLKSKESYDILVKKRYFDSERDKDLRTISTRSKTRSEVSERNQNSNSIILSNIDLSKFDYIEEDHYMRSQSLKLSSNIIEKTGQGYKEITIPPSKKDDNSKRIKQFPVTSLPSWMYNAFQIKEDISKDDNGPIRTNIKFITEKFNEIQSKVLPTVLNTDENLLICAPTSSGKTNIALLSIMRLLSLYRDEDTGIIDTKSFKVVYIAPMKALIKEIVGYFSQRLESYGITVNELSGDVNLSNYEINNTNIIVTTPEKYDIITRKAGQRTFIEKVKLIIIDEIHLLHDIRGAVLESIISRIMLSKVSKNKYDHANNIEIRLIGLSATLPNFKDVAKFLQVNEKKGLFYFDSTYRPIPLKQTFLGISEKKGIKKLLLTNELTYAKTIEKVGENKQVIIFVHSRRETVKTAEYLINAAKGHGEVQKFKTNIPAQANEVFEEDIRTGNIVDKSTLLFLYQNGIGVHHAGMTVKDKKTVEDYFNNKFINVIVSTATLAWGVNLPAHVVIIKGTQVYRPEIGRWGELSFLDILQMMGRAGRVGYIDEKTNYGEGIIITSEEELLFYLSIMNQNLTVESQLIRSLPDALNAEIVNGNITNVTEGAFWLKYTFLYQRMLMNPETYGLAREEFANDKDLFKRRCDLIHSAARLLEKNSLIKYDVNKGEFISNNIGKIASFYYIKHNSMGTYNQNINENMNELDILRLFSLSEEFKLIPLREEEKKEVKSLSNKVPFPLKSGLEESCTKINILLQCYISNISLEGYAISSDMIFISQNAGRIFKALFELCLQHSWAKLSLICLKFCKEIKHRIWSVMTPLRQFKIIPEIIIHKIESKEQLTFDRFIELNVTQMTELLRIQKNNCDSIYKLIHTFPQVNVELNIQPLTRNCLYIEVIITPNFNWLSNYHPYKEMFHLIVEDNDGEIILHHEMFWLKEKNVANKDEKILGFIVPVTEVLPPMYFLKIVSDVWLNCVKTVPISFQNLILPDKFIPPTVYNNNLPKISYKELFCKLFELDNLNNYDKNNNFSLFKKILNYYCTTFGELNNIQNQCISSIFSNNDSIFIGASVGSGKTQIAEFSILKRLFKLNEDKTDIKSVTLKSPILYLCANDDIADEKYSHFTDYFTNLELDKTLKLSYFDGDFDKDKKKFEICDLIISSFLNFDKFVGKYKSIPNLRDTSLIIVDDFHLLNNDDCAIEAALTRLRILFASFQNKMKTKLECRYIVLSAPLSNYSDVCEWLLIPEENRFNYELKVRNNIVEYFFNSFDNVSHKSRINLMTKTIFNLLNKYSYIVKDKILHKYQTIIYICDTKAIKNFLLNFLGYFINNDLEGKCLMKKGENYDKIIKDNINEENSGELYFLLTKSLQNGIGIISEDFTQEINEIVSSLYEEKILQVLVISYKMRWIKNFSSQNVFICDTVYYDENNNCYMDYYIPDILQMVGRAHQKNKNPSGINENSLLNNKCFILMPSSKKEFIRKFLNEPYPLETSINVYLENHFLTDIKNKIINTKQKCVDWLTWSFFYKRLMKNPNYYELKGKTNQHLYEYISELVENKLNELETRGDVLINEDKIQFVNINANNNPATKNNVELKNNEEPKNKTEQKIKAEQKNPEDSNDKAKKNPNENENKKN